METRASGRRPVSAFTRLDLPTLERPAKATSGSELAISESKDAAPAMNSQGPAKSFRAAPIAFGARRLDRFRRAPLGSLRGHQPFFLPPFLPPPPLAGTGVAVAVAAALAAAAL